MREPADTTRAIRLVLAGMSGLTADLVRRIVADQSDMRIVQELGRTEELDAAAAVDVIVTTHSSGGIPRRYRRRFFEAGVPVIAISSGGRLEVFERRSLREAGLEQLLAEIRRVAGAQGAALPTSTTGIDRPQVNARGNR